MATIRLAPMNPLDLQPEELEDLAQELRQAGYGVRVATEARWRLAVIPGHENRPGGLFPEEQKVGLSDELLAVARQTCEQTGRDAAVTTGPLRHKPRVDAGRPTRTIP